MKTTFFDQFTPEQLRKQYSANLVGLEKMLNKAITTNKKVNGYTKKQLTDLVAKYKILSR